MAGVSNYPNGFLNGVTLRGVPIQQGFSGSVFWVNGSTVLPVGGVGGSNGNRGTYQKPFATIDYAVSQCLANRGDVILVMPNHTEDITGAAGIDLDIDGVSIIGLGAGDVQAKVTFSNTASTFEINADNATVQGLWFEATVTGVVIGVNVLNGSDDYWIGNNRFSTETLGTDEFEDCISVTTSDRGVIEENVIDMDEAGSASGIHLAGICLGATLRRNEIQGDFSAGCIEVVTASEHIFIHDNTLINGVHSGLNTVACITLVTGTTGFIQDNQLYTNVAAASTAAVAADSCFFGGGNWVSTTAETVPLQVEGGGVNGIIRATVATGKADETNGLGLFTVLGVIDVWGIQQRAEIVADSAIVLGVQVDATDTTLDSVLVTGTNLSTQTTIGDYANSGTAGGAFTVVQVEDTTGSPMWDTPVRVPAGIIEQTSSGAGGTLVSGYTVYWSEVTAGATVVAI